MNIPKTPNTPNPATPPKDQRKVAARIGHAHLHVRNLEQSVAFYQSLIGLKTTETIGGRFAFLSAGYHHHDLALQAIGQNAPDALPFAPGLYHVAFEADDPAAFLTIWERLQAKGIASSAVDHGISWAIYFDDPDGNGVEVYTDRRGATDGTQLWQGRSGKLTYEDVKRQVLPTDSEA